MQKKKNHSGFNTWRATSVLCSNKKKKTLGSQVSRWSCEIILLCWTLLSRPFFLVTVVTPQKGCKCKRDGGVWRFTISDQGLWEFEPNTTRRQSRSLSDWCQHIRFQISAFISGSGFGPSGSFPYRDWGGNMYRFFKIERCSPFNLSSLQCLMKVPRVFILL